MHKTLDYWSRGMFNFNFPEKGLRLISPPHFLHDLPRKMLLMLYSTNRPNSIVWLPLPPKILGNILGNGDIAHYNCLLTRLWHHKIWNEPYLSNQTVLPHDQKSQDKNLNTQRMKKDFEVKSKALLIIFNRLSIAKNCLRPECTFKSTNFSLQLSTVS